MHSDPNDLSTGLDPHREAGRGHGWRPTTTRIAGVSAIALGLTLGAAGIAGAVNAGGTVTGPGPEGAAHPFDGVRPVTGGIVKSVGNDTFTVTTRDGTVVTVDVTGSTTYRDRAVTSPTFANVTPGSHVAVVGTMTSDTVAATSVLIGGPGAPGGPGWGGRPGWGGGTGGPDHAGGPGGMGG